MKPPARPAVNHFFASGQRWFNAFVMGAMAGGYVYLWIADVGAAVLAGLVVVVFAEAEQFYREARLFAMYREAEHRADVDASLASIRQILLQIEYPLDLISARLKEADDYQRPFLVTSPDTVDPRK